MSGGLGRRVLIRMGAAGFGAGIIGLTINVEAIGTERIPRTEKLLGQLFKAQAALAGQLGQWTRAQQILNQALDRLPPKLSLLLRLEQQLVSARQREVRAAADSAIAESRLAERYGNTARAHAILSRAIVRTNTSRRDQIRVERELLSLRARSQASIAREALFEARLLRTRGESARAVQLLTRAMAGLTRGTVEYRRVALAAAQAQRELDRSTARVGLGFQRLSRFIRRIGVFIGSLFLIELALRRIGRGLDNLFFRPLRLIFRETIRVTDEFRKLEVALSGITGSLRASREAMRDIVRATQGLPITALDAISGIRGLAFTPATASTIQTPDNRVQQLNNLLRILTSLATIDPEQGIKGAQFALREALAGEFRSLRFRFEISPTVVAAGIGKTLADLKADPRLVIEALSNFVETFVGDETLQAFSELMSTQGQLFRGSLEEFFNIVGERGVYDRTLRFLKGVNQSFEAGLRGPVDPATGFRTGQPTPGFLAAGDRISTALEAVFDTLLRASENLIEAFTGIRVTLDDLSEEGLTNLMNAFARIVEQMAETVASIVLFVEAVISKYGPGLASIGGFSSNSLRGSLSQSGRAIGANNFRFVDNVDRTFDTFNQGTGVTSQERILRGDPLLRDVLRRLEFGVVSLNEIEKLRADIAVLKQQQLTTGNTLDRELGITAAGAFAPGLRELAPDLFKALGGLGELNKLEETLDQYERFIRLTQALSLTRNIPDLAVSGVVSSASEARKQAEQFIRLGRPGFQEIESEDRVVAAFNQLRGRLGAFSDTYINFVSTLEGQIDNLEAMMGEFSQPGFAGPRGARFGTVIPGRADDVSRLGRVRSQLRSTLAVMATSFAGDISAAVGSLFSTAAEDLKKDAPATIEGHIGPMLDAFSDLIDASNGRIDQITAATAAAAGGGLLSPSGALSGLPAGMTISPFGQQTLGGFVVDLDAISGVADAIALLLDKTADSPEIFDKASKSAERFRETLVSSLMTLREQTEDEGLILNIDRAVQLLTDRTSTALSDLNDLLKSVADDLANTFKEGFVDAIIDAMHNGADNIEEIFSNLAISIQRILIDLLLELSIIGPLRDFLTVALTGGRGAAAAPPSADPGGIDAVVAQGALFPSGVHVINGAIDGALLTRPNTLVARTVEDGTPEAIVPLRGGGIPVRFIGSQGQGSSPRPQVSIMNVVDPVDVLKAAVARDPDIIVNVVIANIERRGRLRNAIRSA